MRSICVVKTCLNTIYLVNNSNDLTVIKEASKYSIKPTEDKKAHSIIAIWHFEKQNDYLKYLKR